MKEVWAVVSFCRNYEVSNLGNVRSLDHIIKVVFEEKEKTYEYQRKGKVIRPFLAKKTGYLQVMIEKKKYSVHRLVAFAHCVGYADGLVVNHKNGKRDDNRAENLEWVSISENAKHGFQSNGRVHPCLGKFSGDHHVSKAVISTDIKTGEEKYYEAAMDAVREGFDSSSISRCCHGENAYHKGRYWRFAKSRSEA